MAHLREQRWSTPNLRVKEGKELEFDFLGMMIKQKEKEIRLRRLNQMIDFDRLTGSSRPYSKDELREFLGSINANTKGSKMALAGRLIDIIYNEQYEEEPIIKPFQQRMLIRSPPAARTYENRRQVSPLALLAPVEEITAKTSPLQENTQTRRPAYSPLPYPSDY